MDRIHHNTPCLKRKSHCYINPDLCCTKQFLLYLRIRGNTFCPCNQLLAFFHLTDHLFNKA